MSILKYNVHIFDEIQYVSPSDKHTLSPDYTDLEFITRVIKFRYSYNINETEEAYHARVIDELNSYPLIGVVPTDSQLYPLIIQWVTAGHHTSLFDAIDYSYGAPYTEHLQPYFLTSDTNYNVVDVDLLGGNDDGTKEQQFLDFVNNQQN